jgi:hypothetical protein
MIALTFQKMMFSISIRATIPVPCHLRLRRHRPEIAQAIYVTAHFPSFSCDAENYMKVCAHVCVCTRMFSPLARLQKTNIILASPWSWVTIIVKVVITIITIL